MLSRVPQGSVLGPILFVIFINDLPEHVHSTIPFVFADDTKCVLLIRSTNDVSKLQSDVNSAVVWSLSSDLLFNEAKFVHVRFGLSHLLISILQPIQLMENNSLNTIDLRMRIVFSFNLNWTDHYMTISYHQNIRRTFN